GGGGAALELRLRQRVGQDVLHRGGAARADAQGGSAVGVVADEDLLDRDQVAQVAADQLALELMSPPAPQQPADGHAEDHQREARDAGVLLAESSAFLPGAPPNTTT